MNKKRMIINLGASILSFFATTLISFVLTPYLTERIGMDAYGYIGLANSFVSYVTVIATALNSMAGRFITIELHKGNKKEASAYFNSVFVADVILALFLAVISFVIVFNIKSMLSVSEHLLKDVQITFTLAFFNLILSVLSTVFTVATFARDRLDIQSLHVIAADVVKVLAIGVLFIFFSPKIYFVTAGTVAYSLYLLLAYIGTTKKMLPEMKLRLAEFDFKKIVKVLVSGVWNALNSLSIILLTGLDLLLSNLFVSELAMGMLSIAKTIPTAIQSFIAVIASVFGPQFTKLYAKNQISELIDNVKYSIKVQSLILTVPMSGFIVFGIVFYHLWLPTKTMDEIAMIQILSVMTILPNLISGYIYPLYTLNTVTNNLRTPVLVSFVLGLISVGVTYILVKNTNLGIYAIAGTSSVFLLFRVVFFVPMYAAHVLKQKLHIFYSAIFRAIICSSVIMVVYSGIYMLTDINSWKEFIVIVAICAVLGYILNLFMLFNKEERKRVYGKLGKLAAKGGR